jgi:hypothetical protein
MSQEWLSSFKVLLTTHNIPIHHKSECKHFKNCKKKINWNECLHDGTPCNLIRQLCTEDGGSRLWKPSVHKISHIRCIVNQWVTAIIFYSCLNQQQNKVNFHSCSLNISALLPSCFSVRLQIFSSHKCS